MQTVHKLYQYTIIRIAGGCNVKQPPARSAAPESLIGKKQASIEGSGRKNQNPFWPEVKDIHDNKRD